MSSNPRPAKRLRRSTVILSDEDEASTASSLPVRRATAGLNSADSSQAPSKSAGKSINNRAVSSKKIAQSASTRASPKSSPEKSRKSKKLSIDETKNKSLHNFFTKASEQERWHKRSATPDENVKGGAVEDDIIDDDDDNSADEALSKTLRLSKEEKDNQSSRSSFQPSQANINVTRGLPFSSQRFRKTIPPSRASSRAESVQAEIVDDVRPWAERYAPVTLDELAVHKKKVQDVQKWMDDALLGRARQKILVLKGPAGSGKSTTLELIAKQRNCDLVSWQNPDTSDSGSSSSSSQFAEFVARGGDYASLSLTSSEASAHSSNKPRILVVEEFPASMTRNSNVLQSFRSVLLNTATTHVPTNPLVKKPDLQVPPPIVLIMSETLVSSSTAFTDSFTAQRLLGPELINHPSVCVMEFNPVAPTILTKAIDLVIKKEARESQRRRIPGHVVLQKLAEMGDVRNAINALQFLCSRGDENTDWSGTVATNAKRTKTGQPISQMEEDSMKLICSRETTLDMFHAAGKVCYNKREDPQITDSKAQPPPKPPDHLMHLHKPKVSMVNIEDLLNETGTDIDTFVSTVHQNYVLSCNHDNFAEYFDGCSSMLSDAELLNPDNRGASRARGKGQFSSSALQVGSSDALRQHEIGFQVATRGVLFNLPFPVNRAAPPGGGRGAAFKMFYPASLRLWRPIEETEGLIALVTAQLQGQAMQKHHVNNDSVSTWGARANAFQQQPLRADTNETEQALQRSDISQESLVLETLPYLGKIKENHGDDVTLLKKITRVRGFNAVIEEEPDDDQPTESGPGSIRLTQKVEAAHRSLQTQSNRRSVSKHNSIDEPQIEKLWIEDDDIEDDY